jgi:hypothetical protein
VAQFQREGQTLTQNEIQLPLAARAKYVRILWPQNLSEVTLSSVRVLPRPPGRNAEIRWKTLASNRIDAAGAAFYDTQAMFPVQYVDLDFANRTDLARVTIDSRPAPNTDWIPRHAGVFYALRDGADVAHSTSAHVGETFDRYWRVETTREGGWTHTGAPRMKLGWHPHEIVFLAQGPAPFTLVYGSARVGAADAPVDALLAHLSESDLQQRVRPATLAGPHVLSGVEVLSPSTPYRRIVLWGVLVAAVGALAFFAVRVFRETSARSE